MYSKRAAIFSELLLESRRSPNRSPDYVSEALLCPIDVAPLPPPKNQLRVTTLQTTSKRSMLISWRRPPARCAEEGSALATGLGSALSISFEYAHLGPPNTDGAIDVTYSTYDSVI